MPATHARGVLVSALGALLALLSVVVTIVPTAADGPPRVDPPTVSASLKPGESTSVTKTVHTPAIPPKPDIVFLSDTTGSMGAAIANVRTNAVSVMNTVLAAQPLAQFAAA